MWDIPQIFYIVCVRAHQRARKIHVFASKNKKEKYSRIPNIEEKAHIEILNSQFAMYRNFGTRNIEEFGISKKRGRRKTRTKSLLSIHCAMCLTFHVLELCYLLNMHYGNWDKTSDFRSRFANWQVICSTNNSRVRQRERGRNFFFFAHRKCFVCSFAPIEFALVYLRCVNFYQIK